MSVTQALTSLGADRTIWIDDIFGRSIERLANAMAEHVELAERCEIPELRSRLRRARNSDQAADRIAEGLAELSEERRDEVADTFYAALGAAAADNPELSATAVNRVCDLLGIKPEDRWDFDEAHLRLPELCRGGADASVSYIVDLSERGGSATRGLTILQRLSQHGSKGTAFILTNEALTASETEKEVELRRQIADDPAAPGEVEVPVCVIAKERLLGGSSEGDVEESLTIALKRAGLSRSVHEVLWQAKTMLENAFRDASARLRQVPPERLESIVVKRGYQEGVSELHVIERALTAHMSKTLREMFGVDETVRKSAERMRSLRTIGLRDVVALHDENLAAFYEAEVWENGTLLNEALSPVSSGDVFELIADGAPIKIARRYLLLGQPCDIAIRPQADRKQDAAFLVSMRHRDSGKPEPDEEPVPFPIDGAYWNLQFRNVTMARLAILDLASFRKDGRVQFDFQQPKPAGLLTGLDRLYPTRTGIIQEVLSKALKSDELERQLIQQALEQAAAAKSGGGDAGETVSEAKRPPGKAKEKKSKTKQFTNVELDDERLNLTFSSRDQFKPIRRAYCGAAEPALDHPAREAVRPRITWRLRRCGRIRMPYSAAYLEQHIANISRRAFDINYMSEVATNPSSHEGEAEG